MQRQWPIVLVAVSLFTRIPVARWADFSKEHLQKSLRYFPWIGWLVGAVTALVFGGARMVFSVPVSLLLSMAAGIWLTGAFHEDGLADTCDGLGGGMTSTQALSIMKDSRIGTYGMLGLTGALLSKLFLLIDVPVAQVPMALWAGHAVSRAMVVLYAARSQYITSAQSSKIKSAGYQAGAREVLVACIAAGVPLVLWFGWGEALVMGLGVWGGTYLFGRYIDRRLGGYTGDGLGAMQQVGEILVYMEGLILCAFI